MIKIAPSILSADFSKLGLEIEAIDKAGADYIHIDVMDGVFVPSISYGMPVIKSIRSVTDCVFDVHLMITDPIRYIDEFAEVGADIITFHQEAASDPGAVIDAIHRNGRKAGMSVKPHTNIDAFAPFLDQLDLFLVMSVEPGFGGQKYIDASTERIRELRSMLTARGMDKDIEVDGGINLDNVDTVIKAGANVIVAGSAVFRGSIESNVRGFLDRM